MYHSHDSFRGLLFAFLLLVSTGVAAQTNATSNPLSERENDPYSKYGIGELSNQNSTELRGMANITSAYADPYQLNPDNPASLAFLKRTTMEGGAIASTRNVSGSGASVTSGTLAPAYLMIGMPVGKNGGFTFGLRPYTRAYYSLADTIFTSPIGMAQRSYGGQGSVNYAYFGGAYKVHGVSVGFTFGYLFGTFQNTTSLVPVDTNAINKAYTTVYSTYTGLGGVYWKAGIMYEKTLHDSEYVLRVGGTYTASQSLYESLNAYQTSIYNFGDTLVNDTSANQGQLKGLLKLPGSFSAGVMVSRIGLWELGLDYTTTQWSQYNSAPNALMNSNIASKSEKYSLGGSYTPVPAKMHKHYTNVTYRAGAYYGTDYLVINGHNLPNYGLTLGGSLHFKASHFSWVNLHSSIDVGRIGSSQYQQMVQNYFRFTLGLSFNDKWFIPRKYD